MIVKLYRKIPDRYRLVIYSMLLGPLLEFIRNPRAFKWYYREYKIKKDLKVFLPLFKSKIGLEVGGGSFLFCKEGDFPVYVIASIIDGCNFSSQTIWEGTINEKVYRYQGVNLGTQFIGEATEIDTTVDKTYDFIISSNCLEHVANLLKALKSWMSVLKEGGYLFLVLPNKISNFDHKRPDTSFTHLLEDYTKDVNENDMTHFDEIVRLHDLKKDIVFDDREFFIERSMKNGENRCFHHHIFTTDVLKEMFLYFDIEIMYIQEGWSNIYILGRK